MADTLSFYLPFGLEKDGRVLRKGTMHLARTGDELAVQSQEETGMNTRYRDILLLAAVIDDLDGIKPERTDIESMYETDFLYLQMLYREMNSESSGKLAAKCPHCGAVYPIKLAELYKTIQKEP